MSHKRHDQPIPSRVFETCDDERYRDVTCRVYPAACAGGAKLPADPGRVWFRWELEELRRRGVFVSVVHPPVARLWHPNGH